MPIANIIRVSVEGTMPNGEVWSVNPVWQIGGVSTSEDVTQADVIAMATAVNAIVPGAGLTGIMSTSTFFTATRIEARRWDGTLAAQADAARATPLAGSGSTSHPFQTCVVSSLRTAAIGGSGRGRLYWPATGIAINAPTLRPTSGQISSTLAAVKTYLTSITAALAPSLTNGPVLSVWSRLHASTSPVNSINMGDVLDVQRRRRDALIEAYQSVAVP